VIAIQTDVPFSITNAKMFPQLAGHFSTKGSVRRLLIAVLLLAIIFWLRFGVLSLDAASDLVKYTGYWTTLLSLVAFLWLLVRSFRHKLPAWKQHLPGLLAVVVCGGLLQGNEPHRFRVMYDEYAMLSTSMNMHFTRHAAVASAGLYADGQMQYTGEYIDKRPLGFPLLVSLVHDVIGYRPANAFVVNAMVGFAFLGTAYLIGVLLSGTGLGLLGVLLATGLPLVAQTATGGGLDLLSATMVLAVLAQMIRHLRAPTLENAELLVAVYVFAAQIRYESLILGFLVGAAVVLGWWRSRRMEMSWCLTLSPLLLLTPMLINFVYVATPGFFESYRMGVESFSRTFLDQNFSENLYFLFNWDGRMVNSPLLSLVGIVSLLLCLVKFARSAPTLLKNGDPLLAVVGLAAFGLGFAVLTLFYFWGKWTDPIAARLSFPLQLAFLVSTLYASTLFLITPRRLRVAQIVAGIFILGYTLPASARHQATKDMSTSYEASWAVDYLLTHCDETTLILSPSSLPFVCHERPAVGFAVAAQSDSLLQLQWPKTPYRQILVLQDLVYNAETDQWEVWRGSNLTPTLPGMVLEPVTEQVFVSGYLARISRLIRYEPPASTSAVAGRSEGIGPLPH
jgi:hypothetical protein